MASTRSATLPLWVVGFVAISDGFRISHGLPPQPLPLRGPRRALAPRAIFETERDTPPELCGPWELRSSFSGAEEGWVELEAGGQIACSRSMGSARDWYARRDGSGWRLHLKLLDKLGRPVVWVGKVRPDEFLGVAIDGTVSTPGRGKDELVKKAEFRGWKLDS